MEPRVWAFFYGSYINFAVLKEAGFEPKEWEVGRLPGFEIVIRPLANLVPSERECAWGILASGTHAELARLYAHAHDVLGHTYLPQAVLIETRDGKLRPAMTYLCPHMEPKPADPAYVQRIAGPARQFGFPDWYIAKLESFAG